MPRSALLMIHAPFMISIGNSKELRKVADDLDVMAATMRGIYAAASGRPPAEIEKMMDEETWLTAERAQELGFADEVLEDQKPGAAASVRTPILDFYRKTPEGLRGVRAEVALAKLEGLLMRQRIGGIARSASAAAAGVIPGAGN
jgi:ATP-dependent Clp protease protease subunit